MSRVYLSFDDIGLGIQFVDGLEGAGHEVIWPRTPAGVPPADVDRSPDAVILGTPHNDVVLGKWVRAWRLLDPPPAVLVLTDGERTTAAVAAQRAVPVPKNIDFAPLAALVGEAIQFRYTAELSLRFALRALAVTSIDDSNKAAVVIQKAREVDPSLVREALRPRVHEYITRTPVVEQLRAARALAIPEVELADSLTGATTLGRVIDTAKVGAAVAARFTWAMICVGGAKLTREPPDLSTRPRRAVSVARYHLRARMRRFRRGRANYYDVLEVAFEPTPREIDVAAHRLSIRYSPQRLTDLDLGEMTPYVLPLWEQIQRAHAMLSGPQSRAQYNAWLASKGVDVDAVRQRRSYDAEGAEREFEAGQRALSRGDVSKAIAFFASACRRYPDHPDYEAYLAWARYRGAVEAGEDKLASAMRERNHIEEAQAGHQPSPRALLALGLLCAAADDPGAAHWHLEEALACDPQFHMAKQILGRLGQRA